MRPSQIAKLVVLMFLFWILAWAASTAANFIIEYNWWKEVGQVDTWIGMLWYSIAPAAAGAVVAFFALWVAHASGLRFAGIHGKDFRVYSRLIPFALALVAIVFASNWTDSGTAPRVLWAG